MFYRTHSQLSWCRASVLLGLLLIASNVYSQSNFPIFNRHRAPSLTVAVSPDGLLVAIARNSGGAAKRFGRVDLCDTRTGELLRTITGFDGPVWSMTFSKDGRSLITVSTEYHDAKIQTSVREHNEKVFAELKWWDVQTGEFKQRISLAQEGITSVEATWSPGGGLFALVERYLKYEVAQITLPFTINERLARVGYDSVENVSLKLLDAQTAEPTVRVQDVSKTFYGRVAWLFGRLQRPVFSPDGNTLAAIMGEDVLVWNVKTGRKIRTIKKLNGWPTAIAFSPDNARVAIATVKGDMPGGESEISIWDVSSGKSVNNLKSRNDAITCLQFVVRGQALLMGSLRYEPNVSMGTVQLWDLRDNRVKRADIIEGKAVLSMTLIRDQTAVVVQSESEVEIRDARTWRVLHTFERSEDDKAEEMRRSRFVLTAKQAGAVAFSRDGLTVSAEFPGEGIRRWDSRTGGVTSRIPREQSSDGAVLAFSAGGDFVLETTADGVRLRDLRNGTTKQIPLETDESISAFALSADNRVLITADEAGLVHFWHVETGASERTFQTGQQSTAIAIDASGRWLAIARADRSIVLWDLKTGAVRSALRKHKDVINALAFSPDGAKLASGSDDRTVILWEVATGKATRTLKGHDLTVTSLAFSPDGATLASGSGNASVVLWNVLTGKLDRILR